MIITGKTIFKIVYILSIILSIIFSITYIVWNTLQHNPLDPTYLLVAVISIVAMTLVFIKINKEE